MLKSALIKVVNKSAWRVNLPFFEGPTLIEGFEAKKNQILHGEIAQKITHEIWLGIWKKTGLKFGLKMVKIGLEMVETVSVMHLEVSQFL